LDYKAAMEVSDYNKGRSPADVSDKTWQNGTRHYLRPDTMYADERYADITQPEINAAKERQAAREAKRPAAPKAAAEAHGDASAIPLKKEKPLYPWFINVCFTYGNIIIIITIQI